MMLEVNDLVVNYGGIRALRGISFHLNEAEILSIIGANGSGKTTTLNTIAGIKKPKSGQIIYNGTPITGIPPHELVKSGIALSPEGRQIFPDLTVKENLEIGGYTVSKEVTEERIKFVYELFPILGERSNQTGGTLSGGEQQMLALGRALISTPKLLMLDEPSLGLAPKLVKFVLGSLKRIRDSGTSIILVEQNARMALKVSDRGYVLENGVMKMEGKSEDLLQDKSLIEAYLGGVNDQ
ncbi:putative high-affinity branched-chain amino acid ABC transporter, ATP-binding protein LivF [Amygdalobacter nucleatus]|uniref:Putative high-affinity branched-chain amino acid ABC transporter, ATP-binding protein LivF n=2 Tax=Amygdalobacter nucleatus TaxID=3029274 RepID=A0A133YAX1_9FIRM|nr:ABC transporter ATP-binding protein [Amygdalobacter nucleatus]KXB40341.1 putative high-affinity branched-chain amino acid ABC transporter, ATP-binding protein LivF [Amygdalobacter nucleatus]MDF0486341.1 ABC transporter ATP-binding protein [Amygdalobacter nucleatus]